MFVLLDLRFAEEPLLSCSLSTLFRLLAGVRPEARC